MATKKVAKKQIIAVCQQKGGTGKTTTAAAIGAGLVKKGARVLFIDLDAQCNLTFSLPPITPKPTAFDFLTGDGDGMVAAAVHDLEKRTGLYLRGEMIPGDSNLAGADMYINQTGKEYRLSERLAALAPRRWDYIIIDTPPGLGIVTIDAMVAADSIVIPCLPDVFSIQATGQIADTISTVRQYCNPRLKIAGILLTRYNARQILTRETAATLEDAAKQLHTRLFKARIRETLAIREAQARQTNIFDYAPKGNGAADYNQLIEELTDND